MTATLQVCPACGAHVSMAAPSCVHCGHPLKSSGLNLTYVVWFLVGVFLLLLGFGIYRLGPLELPAAKVYPAPQSTLAPSVFMNDKELTVELRSYVLRANRTLPHKPNPMLTFSTGSSNRTVSCTRDPCSALRSPCSAVSMRSGNLA